MENKNNNSEVDMVPLTATKDTNKKETDILMVWLDVETTGLDPNKNNLLEIYSYMTDKELNPLGEYGSVVRYFLVERAAMKLEASFYVKDMHEKTGLWDKLVTTKAKTLKTIDLSLSTLISELKEKQGYTKALVAGNSVRLDLNFVEKFLPLTYQELHYQYIDVSALQWVMDITGASADMEPLNKKLVHSAKEDILESIEQYKIISEWIEKSVTSQ